MLKYLKGLHLLSILLLVVGCLPQEKTTQCKSNEAYDSTARRCLATLGASGQTVNISSITPSSSYTISYADVSVTHSVTVSDPYSNGYQVRWYVTKPNGSTILVGTSASFTFNHTIESTGSYILEVQLLAENGSEVFDSRSWTINVIAETTPTVYTETASPFSTTITSGTTTIDATILNPDTISAVGYQWYVNGSPVAGESGFTSTTTTDVDFNFDPASTSSYFAGSGVYTVQLVLSENGSGDIYSSELWTITNNVPGFATVGVGENTTTFGTATTTPSTGSLITVIDEHPISGAGFPVTGLTDGGFRVTTTNTNDTPVDFCVTADDSDGSGLLEGVDGDGVWVDYLIDGSPIGGGIDHQMVNSGTSYCLFEDFGVDYSYNLPSNLIVEAHTLEMVVYDKFTGSTALPTYKGYNEVFRFTYPLRVRQANTPPIITITKTEEPTDTDYPIAAGSRYQVMDCDNETVTQYSGCEITWGDNKADFVVGGQARPIRLRVKVEDDDYDPYDAAESANFNLEVYINNELINGPTSSASRYSFSDCTYSGTSAIDIDSSDSNDDEAYECDLIINPFDINGPLGYSSTSYIVSAVVRDTGSPYDSTLAAASNEVKWLIDDIEDYNDKIDVIDFGTDELNDSYVAQASNPGTAVALGDQGTPVVNENEIIQFHVKVTDNQRDTHEIKIYQCAESTCTNAKMVPPVATTTVSWTDVNLATNEAVINHQISYTAIEDGDIDAAGDGLVYYLIAVNDEPGSLSSDVPGTDCVGQDPTLTNAAIAAANNNGSDVRGLGDSLVSCQTDDDDQIVALDVENQNPDPTFDNIALVDPALGTAHTVVSGMPFTIDPGPITDESTDDGDVITYQWVVSRDGTADSWIPINHANERVLVWTPTSELLDATDGQEAVNQGNATGTLHIKLCLGDDGKIETTDDNKGALDAEGDDCNLDGRDSSNVTNFNDTWEIYVVPNMAQGRGYDANSVNNTGDGEIAVWVDPSSTDPVVKYMAYVSNGKQIIVEKHVIAADGRKGGSIDKDFDSGNTSYITDELERISFDASTDGSFASNDVTDLTMIGDEVNGSLYIAYQAPVAGVDNTHIRRINISGGKTGFVHDGKFSWDEGYDDLQDNIIISSVGINAETINSDGNAEIVFTSSANASPTMNVEFTIQGLPNEDFEAGDKFCNPVSSCTTIADTASDFADSINASTLKVLQGFTAVASGNTVELFGVSEDDFFEGDIGAAKLGQLMVNQTSGKFQLPIIDIDRSGTDKFKVTMVEGDLGVRIADANLTKSVLVDGGGTNVQASELANDMDSEDTIIIAVKTLADGNINVLRVDSTNIVQDDIVDLFSDDGITDIKVAVSKEDTDFNQSAFIAGKNDSGNFAFARIDTDNANNYDFTDGNYYASEELDSGFAPLIGIEEFDITAGPNEYQAIVAIGYSDYAYLINITNDVPLADCSYERGDQDINKCAPLIPYDDYTAFGDLGFALSDVLKNVTLGDQGSSDAIDENIGDMVGVGLHIDDSSTLGNSNTDGIPLTGILNVRDTSALITEEDTAATPQNIQNMGEATQLPYLSN